jgi:ketosteroid isomerase-like protein
MRREDVSGARSATRSFDGAKDARAARKRRCPEVVQSGSRASDAVILGVMSSEHVELVQRADAAMRRGDVEALIGMCTDDVLLLPARSALHGGYSGPAGLREFFVDNAETFELFTTTWDEAYDKGEQVVMIGRVTARPLGGGPEATVPAAMVVTLEHGKIARVEDLRDRSAALASVGLPA